MREMKDSGIEWIGEIPKDWEITKIGMLYNLRITKVSDTDYSPLSVTKMGVLPQLETVAKTNAHDDRKLVKKGDFVINSRSDRRGSCGISNYNGSVSLINIVLEPKNNMDSGYYSWLFKTIQFADEFYKNGHGIVDDLWTTGWQDMKRIVLPVPKHSKQRQIANFLDTKCSEIDATAEDIQKEIALLEDYKKSVITEAVTKGLNPDAEMKDSGIEWIGEIPKEWNVMFLKYLVQYNIDTLIESTDENFEFDYIDIGSVEYGKGIVNFQKLRFKDAPSRARRLVRENDVIVSTVRTYLKAIAQIPVYDKPIVVSTGFIALRALNKMNSAFLKYVIESNWFVSLIEMNSKGVSYPAINSSEVIQIKVVCPVLLEQQQIADYLDSKCSEIDSLIADKKRQLDILADYKKSLIYEYVTGKKEVPVNE